VIVKPARNTTVKTAHQQIAVRRAMCKNQRRNNSMWQCPKCGRDFKNSNQSHYCGSAITTVDEYIAVQPEEVRPLLTKIRKTIKNAAPKASEKLSWGMPTFWLNENLIHFAVYKKHIGIYPGDLSRLPFKERLSCNHTTKGTIHFSLNNPIDYDLIRDIVLYRVKQVNGET
jgi:uncharacterized protein YdhG (YjbR/CyaY superfamily)